MPARGSLALLLCAALLAGCEEPTAERKATVVRLGELVKGRPQVTWWEGERAHLAEVLREGEVDVLRIDGVARGRYDHVRSGAWGGSCCLMVGMGPWFFPSPNGGRWAHPAERGKAWHMVVDGVPGPAFDDLRPPVWSRDGRRVAYLGQRGASWHCVLDGREGPASDGYQTRGSFGNLPDMQFLPDGRLLCVPVFRRGPETSATTSRLSLDGVLGPAFDHVYSVTVARRGSRWAYFGQEGSQSQLFVDGAPVGAPRQLESGFLALSPDGSHVAFATRETDGRSQVVLDGVERPPREGRVGWIAVLEGLKGPHVVHSQLQGKEAVLVDGETLGAPFDLLLVPQLSPDGTRCACVGRRGEEWTLIVDGQPRLDPAFASALVWSPDSRRLAYDARQQPKGSPSPASSDPTLLACAGVPIFREDGARLAVLESAGSGLRRFVVDGVAGPAWEASVLFSQAVSDGSLTFTAAAGLRYVATRDGVIYAVTERVP